MEPGRPYRPCDGSSPGSVFPSYISSWSPSLTQPLASRNRDNLVHSVQAAQDTYSCRNPKARLGRLPCSGSTFMFTLSTARKSRVVSREVLYGHSWCRKYPDLYRTDCLLATLLFGLWLSACPEASVTFCSLLTFSDVTNCSPLLIFARSLVYPPLCVLLRIVIAIEFISNNTTINTTMPAAATACQPCCGNVVQLNICIGKAVKRSLGPSGVKFMNVAAPTTISGAVSPIARERARIVPVIAPGSAIGSTCPAYRVPFRRPERVGAFAYLTRHRPDGLPGSDNNDWQDEQAKGRRS